MAALKRQAAQLATQRARELAQAQARSATNGINGQTDAARSTPDGLQDPTHASGEDGSNHHSAQASPGIYLNGTSTQDNRLTVPPDVRGSNNNSPGLPVRNSFDHIEEVGQILKTAFPLLIMSLETIVDQIMQRFKATPEEEIYRLVCMLLQDAIQVRHYSRGAHRLLINDFNSNMYRASRTRMTTVLWHLRLKRSLHD